MIGRTPDILTLIGICVAKDHLTLILEQRPDVQDLIGQMGEGMVAIDDLRGEDGVHFVLKVLPQILLVRLIQIAREKAADAVAPQELLELPADVILFRNQRLDRGKNGLQLLFGGKTGFIVWGVPLDQGQVQQASHANHEKLIQIAGENGDKFEPLQQGNLLIQGLQKHTFIESEPGELPVLGIEGVGISFGHSRSPLSSGS